MFIIVFRIGGSGTSFASRLNVGSYPCAREIGNSISPPYDSVVHAAPRSLTVPIGQHLKTKIRHRSTGTASCLSELTGILRAGHHGAAG